jgi:hypothetical protein
MGASRAVAVPKAPRSPAMPLLMKNPILIGLFSASILTALNASASDPSAELISDMKKMSGLHYSFNIPSEGTGKPGVWVFVDEIYLLSVEVPENCGESEIAQIAWSQRRFVKWAKASGILNWQYGP